MKFVGFLVTTAFFLSNCSTSRLSQLPNRNGSQNISSLRFLDEYVIPHKMVFDNTQVGGLSGIDYNAAEKIYYLISDDRSNINPARFYKADIKITGDKIDTIIFKSSHSLLSPAGNVFPSHREFPSLSPDPESIRFNAASNTLIWTSEGEKQKKNGTEILQHPFIYEMDLAGKFLDSFLLPGNLKMQMGDNGPRRNSVLEGSSYTKNYEQLFVSCEEPLLQDGSAATTEFAGALTRITRFDAKTKKALAQYAYPLDAIAHSPKPAGAFAVNGISEILCLDEQHLLIVERSFSTGRLINTIKIFIADLGSASNVLSKASLKTRKSFEPASKKLLLNTDSLNRYFDNIEGICLGPLLENGNRTLILIADDNFNPLEKTQVFLFELVP